MIGQGYTAKFSPLPAARSLRAYPSLFHRESILHAVKGRDAVLSGDRFSKILPVALRSLFAEAGQVPPADTPNELVMRLQKEFDLLSTPDLDQHRLPKLLTREGIKIVDGLPPNIERKKHGFRYRVRCKAAGTDGQERAINIVGQEGTVHAALLALRRVVTRVPSERASLPLFASGHFTFS